jgi:hypothetical protein
MILEGSSRNLRGKPHVRGTMGDKSPKATSKQANQKQAKNNANNQKKNSAIAAKKAPATPPKKK